jgi:hypothetical protein
MQTDWMWVQQNGADSLAVCRLWSGLPGGHDRFQRAFAYYQNACLKAVTGRAWRQTAFISWRGMQWHSREVKQEIRFLYY